MKKLTTVLGIAALAILPASANAAVTLGQLDPAPGPISCMSPRDMVPTNVTSGPSYAAPGAGTITSWSTNAKPGAGQFLALKVFNRLADPDVFAVVTQTAAQPLSAGGGTNTFPASLTVKAGDRIGLSIPSGGGMPSCYFGAGPSDQFRFLDGNVGPGGIGNFTGIQTDARLNVSAVFNPSNTVTIDKTTTNKRKGTATVEVTVPNPGELTAAGNGVKASGAAGAAVFVPAAGKARLTIAAKGKKRKKLNSKGKVKLAPVLTFTPNGGVVSTQTVKVGLKKKKPRKRRR